MPVLVAYASRHGGNPLDRGAAACRRKVRTIPQMAGTGAVFDLDIERPSSEIRARVGYLPLRLDPQQTPRFAQVTA